ncbi:type II toxin-antitoxin system prevent-host-death family antitoxin [Caenispirillum bisanense]|uniref:Antitoxin n=1 Tax=Caenispirillum bisanense TaxID=414052 RepID=A0A286G2N2_9PROT|nr:type II toxin-antitoxin system prevent-host-death family antitoxin [Caenispirillum bisanense]SOD89800.1 prevent-host-death family protein [Caenispirillum bisanense]
MPATFSSRDFNQDLAGAKRAAKQGPVVITDRGEPAYVLMTHAEFRRLKGERRRSIVDLLRQDEPDADFDFQPPRLTGPMSRPEEY